MMRNTLPIPLDQLLPNGNKMFEWLGSFWTALFEDTQLIRRQQDANGLLFAQLYLKVVETLNLTDHTTSAAFERKRWRAIPLRYSTRNTGPAVSIRLGGAYTPVIGPQTAKTAEEHGLRVDVLAPTPSVEVLVDALADHGATRRAAMIEAGQPVTKPSERRPASRRKATGSK